MPTVTAIAVKGSVAVYASRFMPRVRFTMPAIKPFQKVVCAGVIPVIRAVK